MERIPKMKLEYATQIFSQTVGRTMGFLAEQSILPKECKETAEILLFFDELFDSLNGGYGNNDKHAKPLLRAVTPTSRYKKFWLEAKKKILGMRFLNKVDCHVEDVSTLSNWAWTLNGVQLLLKN